MDNVFKRYWTDREESRLMSTIRSRASVLARRDAAWIMALVASGFRIGEFSLLNVSDAKLALETGWLFSPRENRKGGKVDHQVPVTQPLRESLRELLKIERQMGGTGADAEPLVLSRNGRRMSIRGYQHKLGIWCFEAELGRGSPHFARHTRAMRIMKRSTSNDPRGLVKAALGQASIESTAVYTGVTKEDLQRELHAIDGAPRARKQDLRKLYEERRAS